MKRLWRISLIAICGVVALVLVQGLIRDLLERPGDHFDDPQTLALAEALMARDEARITALVAAGADLNAQDKDGLTLLQWQVRRGDLRRTRQLLLLGADPNLQGLHGNTALHLAAAERGDAMLKLLLDNGGDPDVRAKRLGESPIFIALDARAQKNIDLLIARGADIELPNSEGSRPLASAAAINSFDTVVMLLKRGADPEATDRLGLTFQPSFFRTDQRLLNAGALRNRTWVIDFLNERGIPLDPQALRAP